jgi:serine/threonine protein kinase
MNKLLQMTDLLTQSFGDYQIIEPLYSKAFGMVYLAEHVFLKKPYLLHTINIPEGRQEEFVIGIQEEINKVAKLNHPHILRTVNVMEHEGVLVIPSECLLDDHGEILDLATYIQNLGHPLSEEEVYQIALQIGSAIDYAWRENTIAHTGISLSSILLKKRGTDIQVMLGDFGLWHVVGITELVGQNYQTCLEHFSFLSPEQREGGIADHKSDIYAFGTLLYKLLTGRLPSGIFPMPGQIAHNLVYHWDRFLSHCLQHDPEQRLEWVVPELKNLPISTTISSELVRELRPFIKPTEIVKPEVVGDPAAIFAVDSTVTLYRPQEEEKGAVEPTHTEMVIIRSGCYGQGSSQGGRDEMPKHQIYLRSFALDIHPVTNAQFVRFLAAMGGEKDGNNNDMIHLRHARIKRSGGKLSIESGYANHPVVGVSWYGAVAYAKWIGKRLPTEANGKLQHLLEI